MIGHGPIEKAVAAAREREWFAVRPESGADGMPCPFCVVSAREANNTVESCPHGSYFCASCGCVVVPLWCYCGAEDQRKAAVT
jgi:hypothetical protein